MILVTGGTGLIGSAVLREVSTHDGRAAVGTVRSPIDSSSSLRLVCVGELHSQTNWSDVLSGVSAVVHTAARVHVMRDTATEPIAEFRRVNVEGTANLARQAAAAGIGRFIFLSSIKVNGEITETGHSFHPDDPPAPSDAYAISKFEAEQTLRRIAVDTGMEVVIIRPPLVYGSGVTANFRAMMRLIHQGVPLPLGAIHNQRSLIALDNLVDCIKICISHPAAANQTFLVSDGEDLSTTQLLRRLGTALGRPARLIPVPAPLLELGAKLVGRASIAQRLCGSLCVDITKTRQLLRWAPPFTVDESLGKAAAGFLRETRG